MACVRVLLVSLLIALAAPVVWADRIACPAGGNAEIQACIDEAARGDTIVFAGSYAIDPSQADVRIVDKSDLRLVGDEDDPPLFTCHVEPDGRPTMPSATSFNSAFTVLAGTPGQPVSRLLFAGLHFKDCYAALLMAGVNGGRFADIRVRELSITNHVNGVLISAPAQGVDIRDCSIERTDTGIYVDAPGGHSSNVVVTGNDVVGLDDDQPARSAASGIFVTRSDGRVYGNSVTGFTRFFGRVGLGIVIVDDTVGGAFELSVYQNLVRRTTAGISLTGRALATGRVWANVVENAAAFGINLRFGANGWRVGLNDISGSGVTDVNLLPKFPLVGPPPALPDPFGTYGNTIYLSPGQTYVDPGRLNTIIYRDE